MSNGEIVADHANIPNDEAQGAEFIQLLTSHQLNIYFYVRSARARSERGCRHRSRHGIVLWEKRKQSGRDQGFPGLGIPDSAIQSVGASSPTQAEGALLSDALVDELALQAPRYANVDNDLMDGLQRCVEQLAARDRELLSQRYRP